VGKLVGDYLKMVVVRIELWPDGDKEKARDLGLVIIRNDGTGDDEIGAYEVVVARGGRFFGKEGAWKKGHLDRFIRKLSPYHLVARALAACGIQ
jgi:hypothetical protein